MTICRIRVGREAPVSGRFEWALLDEKGTVLDSGSSDLSQPPLAGRDCELVLASDLVLLERVAVPAAQQRRLSSVLRFLAEDSVVPDPERVHVAAEASPGKSALCVGIIDRQWLAQALARLERSGLSPVCAYPECLLPELAPRSWTVVWNGPDSFARTADMEGFALDATDEGKLPVSLVLALENARSTGVAPERLVLRIPPEGAAPDTQSWSAALGIAVERGAPWRWAQARQRPRLDLLQGEFAPRSAARGRALRRPAMLAAALLVIASCGIALDWAAKVKERDRLLGEMRSIYRASFGESAVLVDPPLQMRRALAELRLRSGQAGPTDFVALLGPLADRLLDPARQRLESLVYDNGTLTLSLRPRDPRHFATLADELRAKTPVQGMNIRLENVQSTTVRVTASAQEPK
jgi:general secretion pathway protein L